MTVANFPGPERLESIHSLISSVEQGGKTFKRRLRSLMVLRVSEHLLRRGSYMLISPMKELIK